MGTKLASRRISDVERALLSLKKPITAVREAQGGDVDERANARQQIPQAVNNRPSRRRPMTTPRNIRVIEHAFAGDFAIIRRRDERKIDHLAIVRARFEVHDQEIVDDLERAAQIAGHIAGRFHPAAVPRSGGAIVGQYEARRVGELRR